MAADEVSRGLKQLTDTDVHSYANRLPDFINNINTEGVRASLILFPSVIETALTTKLKDRLSHLNGDERTRLFDWEGMAGTFSKKIQMAYLLEIIDRPLRKRCDRFREIRNAAAHSAEAMTFLQPAIREAVKSFYAKTPSALDQPLNEPALRLMFQVASMATLMKIIFFDKMTVPIDKFILEMFNEWVRAAREEENYNIFPWVANHFTADT